MEGFSNRQAIERLSGLKRKSDSLMSPGDLRDILAPQKDRQISQFPKDCVRLEVKYTISEDRSGSLEDDKARLLAPLRRKSGSETVPRAMLNQGAQKLIANINTSVLAPHITTRLKPQSTRDSIWERHKEIIRLLYVQRRIHLKILMESMRVDYGLPHRTVLWKTKLKAWGFTHHTTIKDAAHILKCLNQASSKDDQEVVLYFDRVQRREDIAKYIQRSKEVASEDDLLSRIGPQEPTPDYIALVSLAEAPIGAQRTFPE